LFEAVRNTQLPITIQIACSSEEYGKVLPNEVPIKETNPLRPLSPYAVSKLAMDYLGYQYHESYGMRIIRTRGFNHTGPRRGEVFAESSFAKQIAEIEKGKREPVVYVGNLDAQRDYTDVRDMARAYYLAVQKCDPGEEYNIASGKTWRIRAVLDLLISMSSVKVEVRQDPSRMRPSDVEILLGDNTKFVQKTGWKPEIAFEKTMEDLLNYWRGHV
jgi:GDP-4-dehydro-6-deoxy-D-mannose reductase